MKSYYFYGVDVYGNVHAFKSKGYRNELADMNTIKILPSKDVNTFMACTYNRYILVHNTNDINTYSLVRYK